MSYEDPFSAASAVEWFNGKDFKGARAAPPPAPLPVGCRGRGERGPEMRPAGACARVTRRWRPPCSSAPCAQGLQRACSAFAPPPMCGAVRATAAV